MMRLTERLRSGRFFRASVIPVAFRLLFSGADVFAETGSDYPSENTGQTREHKGQSRGGVGGAVSIDLFGILRGFQDSARDRKSASESLAKGGPKFPDSYSMSYLVMQGFVKGGWPMVVDYRSEPGSLVWLEVTADGVEPYLYRLDGAKPKRQQVVVKLPERFGDKPRPGAAVIRAVKDAAGESVPSTLRVYGLGAGPRAVGSVTIDEVVFAPGTIRVGGQERAFYRFHSLSDFNKVGVEILRVANKDGEIRTELVKAEPPITSGISKGAWIGKDQPRTWDGKNKDKKISLGAHLLQVRAWLGSADEGDWVAAWSDGAVVVAE